MELLHVLDFNLPSWLRLHLGFVEVYCADVGKCPSGPMDHCNGLTNFDAEEFSLGEIENKPLEFSMARFDATQHHPWTWGTFSNQQSRKSNSGYAMTLQKGREATWFQLFQAKIIWITRWASVMFCGFQLPAVFMYVGTRLSLMSLYQIAPLIQSLGRFRLVTPKSFMGSPHVNKIWQSHLQNSGSVLHCQDLRCLAWHL